MEEEGGEVEKRLKVVKTWLQSNFFQLDVFWQLTGKASRYKEIQRKNLFVIDGATRGKCPKQSEGYNIWK